MILLAMKKNEFLYTYIEAKFMNESAVAPSNLRSEAEAFSLY